MLKSSDPTNVKQCLASSSSPAYSVLRRHVLRGGFQYPTVAGNNIVNVGVVRREWRPSSVGGFVGAREDKLFGVAGCGDRCSVL